MQTSDRTFLTRPLDEEISNQLQTNIDTGLASQEVHLRLKRDGPNILYKSNDGEMSFRRVFMNEIGEPMQILLITVGIGYAIWGELFDSLIVFAIILLMILIEILNEFRAKRAMQLLSQKVSRQCNVIRDGKIVNIENKDIVIGDVLVLKSGDIVPADARLIESYSLEVNEMALTGESIPVQKDSNAIVLSVENAGDCLNAVFATTSILKGRCTAVVFATGRNTEIGSVLSLAKEAGMNKKKTQLQKAMRSLAKYLTIAAIIVSVVIPVVGLIRRRPFSKMILAGLSLAFCLIPEELPILIKSVLAIGSLQLSKVNVLIKSLHAAETLGTVTHILTDKTGTLTYNSLRLANYTLGIDFMPDKVQSEKTAGKEALYKYWILSSDIELIDILGYLDAGNIEDIPLSNPFDIAIIRSAKDNLELQTIIRSSASILKDSLLEQDFPFDSHLKYSTKVRKIHDSTIVEIIRGAPEYIVEKCSSVYCSADSVPVSVDFKFKRKIVDLINIDADKGLRTVAIAMKIISSEEEQKDNYQFIGFFAFEENIRNGTRDAIRICREAGIKISIVTGDHELTASRVAHNIELSEDIDVVSCQNLSEIPEDEMLYYLQNPTVFARATPFSKYTICERLQAMEYRVAVTGDGVNDTAAISLADVGIAMGGGTDVCKEAAQVILLDDQFQTLATGILESRKLFDNLYKSIQFYLGCKLALVLLFTFSVLFNYEFPLTPIQTIILELFMDIGASTTFTTEKAESDIMKQKPRDPSAKFVDPFFIINVLKGSLSLTSCVLSCYLIGIYSIPSSDASAITVGQTMAFAGWIFGHLMLAMNSRTISQPILFHGILENKLFFVWASAAICTLFSVSYVPFLRRVMGTIPLDITHWLIVITISIVSTIWIEIVKLCLYFWHNNLSGNQRVEYQLV
jgi:Ca2+-transporting ATPase